MSCVLRISGKFFRVHEFLLETQLDAYESYLIGDQNPFRKTLQNSNGCNIEVSQADFDRFDLQKNDAVKYLEKNFKKLNRLKEFNLSENEFPVLDFAIEARTNEVAIQYDVIEPKLLKLAGDLNIGIEISQYR